MFSAASFLQRAFALMERAAIEDSYDKLPSKSSDNMIRVLDLFPGQKGTPLVGRLLQKRLGAQNTSYVAISYYWGDPGDRGSILCQFQDGSLSRLNPTRSLTDALHHIRHPSKHQYLWADAICINQGDGAEKAQQVSLMAEVYSAAQRAIVWLGQVSANEHKFMLICEQAGAQGVKDEADMADLKKCLLTLSDLPANVHEVFLARPWFRRIWILQEMARSKFAVFASDDKPSVKCRDFFAGLTYAFALGLLDRSTMFSHYKDSVIPLYMLSYRSPQFIDTRLMPLLERTRSWESTRKVDKIYALLNITSSDWKDIGIRIDYESDELQVYIDVARSLYRAGHGYDLLRLPRRETPVSNALPSWVPDWSDTHLFEAPLSPHEIETDVLERTMTMNDASRSLILKTRQLAIVSSVSKVFASPDASHSLKPMSIHAERVSAVVSYERFRTLSAWLEMATDLGVSEQSQKYFLDRIARNTSIGNQDAYRVSRDQLFTRLKGYSGRRALCHPFWLLWLHRPVWFSLLTILAIPTLIYSQYHIAAGTITFFWIALGLTLFQDISAQQKLPLVPYFVHAQGRRLAVIRTEHTDLLRLALVPPGTKAGDVLMSAASIPLHLVIRPLECGHNLCCDMTEVRRPFRLVGEAYVSQNDEVDESSDAIEEINLV